jgi:hypothetical protein
MFHKDVPFVKIMLSKSSVTDASNKSRSTGEVDYSCSIPNLLSSDNTCDAAKKKKDTGQASVLLIFAGTIWFGEFGRVFKTQ